MTALVTCRCGDQRRRGVYLTLCSCCCCRLLLLLLLLLLLPLVMFRALLSVILALSAAARVFPLVLVPPHEQVARMARFVVGKSDWASVATISSREPVRGQPFSNSFSISDGPPGASSGTPYLYLTHLDISVQDLQVNPQVSLSVSLAQSSYCRNHGFDPQSPLCAHIILSGSLMQLNDSEEVCVAKRALFSRHPQMQDWPSDHGWFFAKINITQVWVLDYFGGVQTVTPEEYYRAHPYHTHTHRGSDTL